MVPVAIASPSCWVHVRQSSQLTVLPTHHQPCCRSLADTWPNGCVCTTGWQPPPPSALLFKVIGVFFQQVIKLHKLSQLCSNYAWKQGGNFQRFSVFQKLDEVIKNNHLWGQPSRREGQLGVIVSIINFLMCFYWFHLVLLIIQVTTWSIIRCNIWIPNLRILGAIDTKSRLGSYLTLQNF